VRGAAGNGGPYRDSFGIAPEFVLPHILLSALRAIQWINIGARCVTFGTITAS